MPTFQLPEGETIYYHQPSELKRAEPVVFQHGLGREAAQICEQWTPIVEQLGAVGLFPLLTEEMYPRYQFVELDDDATRTLLPRLLWAAAERFGTSATTCDLGGFSGGGQFTHRSLLFDSGITIRKAMVLSPGTYCFPNTLDVYPFGMLSEKGKRVVDFDRLITTDILAYVGAEDHGSPDLGPEIYDHQGMDRVERARAWANAVRAYAHGRGVMPRVLSGTVPLAAHSLTDCLANGLRDILLEFLS